MLPFSQIEMAKDVIKDTVFYAPFAGAVAMVVLASIIAVLFNNSAKKAVDEAVAAAEARFKAVEVRLQDQIDGLVREIAALRDVNGTANRHLLLAIDDLPHNPETESSRRHLHRAVESLNRAASPGA